MGTCEAVDNGARQDRIKHFVLLVCALTATLERARALVRSDGTILIEDFAFEEMNRVTADWLYNELPTLRNDGVLNTHDKGFGAEFLAAGGDLPVICQESTPNEGDQ